ncbi:uncharacterized protein LOC121999821 [Zingiber officinale]|uniref:Uncharacterized protein n=1 Tax=Zingiber officinale TaxID=94328 RepID=A0A8J5FVF5_ZINOF|nr:uncharacterized protein LOC121999821 [Zingiber officinale]KAG6491511.1 hypothetical protein ZIOFF_046443 [Zingiber officinale]
MIDWTAGCFGSNDGGIVGGGGGRRQVVRNVVTCFYVTSLSMKKKEVLIMVTWQKNNGDEPSSVTVIVDDDTSAAAAHFEHPRCNSQILRKKGSRSFFSGDSMFLLLWDISAAKYGPGFSSEPTKDFYLILAADAELVLLLGDKGKHYVDKFPTAPFWMYSRYEQAVVPASAAVHYSTKARFRDGGQEHDVSVICRVDERDARNGELSIAVDRKRAIHVPNVGWNFRGNQAITVDDGSAVVDVLWDVRDWWFHDSSGGGLTTFLFQARSSPESEQPCWLPEEAAATAAPPPFTLSIIVSKK